MDPSVRRSIEPLDVLYFLRQAGAIVEGRQWMAVFAVDEVCMLATDNPGLVARNASSSIASCLIC